MQKGMDTGNNGYEYLNTEDVKKITDKALIQRVEKTYEFLTLCEIYLQDVKDDYGKKKIASLRVDIVNHHLQLLIKECFARGVKHGIRMA